MCVRVGWLCVGVVRLCVRHGGGDVAWLCVYCVCSIGCSDGWVVYGECSNTCMLLVSTGATCGNAAPLVTQGECLIALLGCG